MKKLLILALMTMSGNLLAQQDCMIGEVKFFAGNFAPRNWAFARGQLLPIAQNQALFSILGTQYGGDGRTTFALPDLSGRSAVGTDNAQKIKNGQKGGSDSLKILANNLPPARVATRVQGLVVKDKVLLKKSQTAANSVELQTVTTDNLPARSALRGSGTPLAKRSPFLGLNYIVCLYGVYPSRS